MKRTHQMIASRMSEAVFSQCHDQAPWNGSTGMMLTSSRVIVILCMEGWREKVFIRAVVTVRRHFRIPAVENSTDDPVPIFRKTFCCGKRGLLMRLVSAENQYDTV